MHKPQFVWKWETVQIPKSVEVRLSWFGNLTKKKKKEVVSKGKAIRNAPSNVKDSETEHQVASSISKTEQITLNTNTTL